MRRRKEDDDIYISMAAHNEKETKTTTNGRKWDSAIRLREKAFGAKGIWADLDVKPDQPDKAYPSTEDALKDLKRFRDEANFPPPNVVVLSGTGGVHVYWTFDCTLSVDDWQPRANALTHALKAHNVKHDSQCTVDPVRLLRVPETWNAKQTPHLPVKLAKCEADYPLQQIDDALAPYFGKSAPAQESKAPNVNDELSGGITTHKAALRKAGDVAAVCPWFAEVLTTGGERDSNPLWFDALTVAYYCEDSETLVHDLSNKHPGYHPDETTEKFSTIKKDRDARPGLGWTKCQTIQSHGAAQCASCPLLAKHLSPLNHAKIVPPAIALSDFPEPFYRGDKTGYVLRRGADGEADEVVCEYKIFDAWVSPGDKWQLHFKFETGGAGVQHCKLDFASTASDQALTSSLAGQGFTVASKHTKAFMVSFMKQLQSARETVSSAQAFGWFADAGKTNSFIFNGVRFTPEGNKRAAHPSERAAAIYTPQGEASHWLELVRLVNRQKRPALDMFIAAAFAAPLLYFTGEPGVVLGGWSSESGVGKTTALSIAAAVWGHPKLGQMGLTDTENSADARMREILHLPLQWDEIRTAEEQAKFAHLIFAVTRGNSKGRAKRDGTMAATSSFKTSISYASNSSMVDIVNEINKTSAAGNMRFFEVRVAPVVLPTDTDRIDDLRVHLENNYGWAGLAYAKFLGENVDKVHNEVRAAMVTLNSKLNRTNDERYWIAHIATQILGAHYANKLGLTEIDVPALKAFLVDELQRMRAEGKVASNDFALPVNLVRMLADFLREKRARNTLFTDKLWLTKGKPRKDAIKLRFEGREVERMEALQVHVATDQKLIRISEQAFGEWLKFKKYDRKPTTDAMQRTLGARRVTGGILGAGTRFALTGFQEPLWELAVAGTELENYVDWDTEP